MCEQYSATVQPTHVNCSTVQPTHVNRFINLANCIQPTHVNNITSASSVKKSSSKNAIIYLVLIILFQWQNNAHSGHPFSFSVNLSKFLHKTVPMSFKQE